ncbi:hypothetical protein [Aquibaculum sediminis]|uniref:terminase small subunit-like protein n=1 Tax=Aquibaculum sediminis TaxID=3231907 RepID=UPI0034519C9E
MAGQQTTGRQITGRPRGLNAALRREICERVAEGETLTRICHDPHLPPKAAVLKALAADAGFRRRYEQARRLQAEHWAEEILEIVDAGGGSEDAEGKPLAEKDLLARAKLRVDARKWLLARLGGGGEASPAAEEEDEEADPDRLFAREDLSEEERSLLRGLLEQRLARHED